MSKALGPEGAPAFGDLEGHQCFWIVRVGQGRGDEPGDAGKVRSHGVLQPQ